MKNTFKITVLTWLGIYPLITILLYVLGDSLNQLVMPLRTLILTLVLVPLMTLVMMPFLRKLFDRWLKANVTKKSTIEN